ncbi:hypothetical protein HN873_064133 [Arachis hypogaea]
MNTEVLHELGFPGCGKTDHYRKHWHTHCQRSATRSGKVGIQWKTAVEFAGRYWRTICCWYSWSKKIDVGGRVTATGKNRATYDLVRGFYGLCVFYLLLSGIVLHRYCFEGEMCACKQCTEDAFYHIP